MALFGSILAFVLVVGSASAANGVANFFGGNGVQGGKFSFSNSGPGGVAVNQEGSGGATAGDVYVVDRGNNRVQQFSAAGAFVRTFGLNVGGPGVHVCTVAPSCVAGSASVEAGGMSNPQGIAIDQTNGNVFVTDQTNRRVDVFSANGTFQAAFGYGVDTGAEALELCTTASTCAAGTSGANAGQFGSEIGYPAVAPAGSPNAGHLYVADKSNRRVDQFEPTLTAGEVTGIAFVRGWGWGVDTGASEFEQCTTASVCQAPNTSFPTTNPGQFGFGQPQALAVDSNGNLYTAESSGNNRAQKFDSTGNPVAFSGVELNGFPGPADIAVDKTTSRVYVLKEVSGTNEKRVLEFNSTGALIETHASGTTISSANGLAQIQGTSSFYISTSQNDTFRGVFFLGTKVNPTASVEAPSPLTAHSATLKGKVNPQGFSTRYRFEFSSDGGSTWTKFPANEFQETDLGSGTSDVAVEQNVSGLIGGHQYLYRIVATKPFGAGSITTSEQVFITPGSAPTVETFASAVTTKTAVLNAEINPQNQATTYHFEWGTADCASNPCTSVPVPDAGVGSGETPVTVSKEITGLDSAATYHFRVLATNATGTTEGPDTIFHTYAPFVPDTDCPNQAFRDGASANLSDCRAYEMVSPVDKAGGDIVPSTTSQNFNVGSEQAALDGDKLAYASWKPFGDALSSLWVNQFIASRGTGGWSTHSINPPHKDNINFSPILFAIPGRYSAFTEDLSTGFLYDESKPPLTPDALAAPYLNNYLWHAENESYEALTTEVFSGEELLGGMGLQGYSADGSHAVFVAQAQLTPDAKPGGSEQLYDYHDGELELVSVLPNGEAASRSSAGAGGIDYNLEAGETGHAISEDGSRIFWTADLEGFSSFTNNGRIYARIDGETTIPISGSVSATNNAVYWTASTDGSQAVFNAGTNLYRFDVDTETPSLIAGEVDQNFGVLGASEDASHVYFLSKEVLAGGATAGQPNLYLDEEGGKTFIATLAADEDSLGGNPTASNRAVMKDFSQVTPDGRHVVFQSRASLTGYDNTSLDTGTLAFEVYAYDADADQLACVSCNPSGGRPESDSILEPHRRFGSPLPGQFAAWLPTPRRGTYTPRMVADDGNRIFFNALDALVPQDTNGVQDVYQWVAQGIGGCEEADGCVSLISTGTNPEESTFVDASEGSQDVFFRTRASIDPEDPGLIDIYDARVGGGFPQPLAPLPCVGDACQSVPPAPNDPTPASASFRGAGDPVPQPNCSAAAKRAKRLNRKAKQASRKGQQERAARLAKQAKRLSRSAARCRRANRGTGR